MNSLRPRITRRIPWKYVKPWQLAQKKITDKVHSALDSSSDVENDPAVTRSLKWWLISHALFFRHQGKTGRGQRRRYRHKDNTRNRFDWWSQGNMRKLVDLFVRDAETEARRHNRGPSPSKAKAKTIKRAMEFLEMGLLSKCRSLLLSTGLGDMNDPAVVAQLDAKHPERQHDLPGSPPVTNAPPIAIDPDDLRKKYRSLARLAGVGPDGLPNEHLIALAMDTGDTEADKAIEGHAYMAEQYFNGALPRWWYATTSAVRMLALIKTPGKPDVRPVAIGNCRRRAWTSFLVKRVALVAGDSMHVQQVAVGVSSGIPILFQGLSQHLEDKQDHCVLKVDIRNAHNECSRAAMLNAYLSHPDPSIRQLATPFWATYSPSATIVGLNARSEDGGQQGDAFASLGFTLGIHPALRAADEFLAPHGGKAMAISDDMYFVGPKEKILEIACTTRDRLHADFQCTLQPSKSEIWGRDIPGLRDFLSTCGEEFKIGSSHNTTSAPFPAAGYGIMVGGLPVGDTTFIDNKLSAKVERILEDNKKISDYLRSYSSSGLFAVLWHCCQPLMQHEMQNLPPRVLTTHLTRFDESLRKMITEAAINIQDMDEDNLLLRRMRLPIRLKGAGLRQMNGWLAHAAFIGGLLRTLPELSTRTIPGNRTRTGMHNALASELLGEHTFDIGNERDRFRPLFEGGSTLAEDFLTSWDILQAASKADTLDPDGNILSVPAEAAGCFLKTLPAEDATAAAKLFPAKFQHLITRQVEEERAIDLRRDMKVAMEEHESRIGTAFTLATPISSSFIACPPTQALHIRSSEYSVVWHDWAGIPNPHFSSFVGKTISSRKTRNGGTFIRRVDPHGDHLGAVTGRHMNNKHDEMKWALYRLAELAKFPVECEPNHLFHGFALNVPENGHVRDLIRPDFLFKTPTGDRIGDVKTISFTASNYGGANRTKNGAAVENKANKVHKEYLDKARKADIKWNNTPQNAIGPIESRLNEFGTVIPFVFGYLGEANKAVRTLLKEIATVGARNLWRQMGQTCQVNAYGVLLNSYRRTLGVAAVRANARMKLRVLGTLLGRSNDAQHNSATREEARFRKAEWDNYLRHGPRAQAEYHHGFEHCI